MNWISITDRDGKENLIDLDKTFKVAVVDDFEGFLEIEFQSNSHPEVYERVTIEKEYWNTLKMWISTSTNLNVIKF